MELMTGIEPKNGVDHIAWQGVDATIERVPQADIETHFQGLSEALEGLWETAVEAQKKRREQNARARGIQALPRVHIGDFVLVAQKTRRSKVSMTWTGPHNVVGTVNPFVWIVEPLGAQPGKHQMEVHVARMRRFSNAALGTRVDMDRLRAAARRDFPQNFIASFRGHRVDEDTGTMMITVRWLGWGPEDDSEEPIHRLVEDDPPRVDAYLRAHRDEIVCAQYLLEYFQS